MKTIGRFAVILVAAVLVPAPAHAQAVSANITGTVTDSSGAAVPDARVTATETATGIRSTSTRTVQGRYDITFLKPGTYEVEIEAKGFKRTTRSSVIVGVSTTVRVANLTNTPHFGTPQRNVSTGTFGEITSTLGGYGNRQVQFALRLLF
jgi:hypothetical protein